MNYRKIIFYLLGLLLFISSGISFHKSRHYNEPVVLGPGVSEVKKLSEYFPAIKGSINDCYVYFFEGKEPGGTLFVMGGSHPEEPAGRLAPWLIVENGIMKRVD